MVTEASVRGGDSGDDRFPGKAVCTSEDHIQATEPGQCPGHPQVVQSVETVECDGQCLDHLAVLSAEVFASFFFLPLLPFFSPPFS
ncbi:hypothetical protein, partial [Micromonospora fiedleri]|uniref:hypothetical protein n=1 Tax=Micromonospora fiedleri TaxID=1157498 RepID=UPI001EE2919E